MHIIIYGVGAIGGFYGTKLAAYQQNNPELKLSFIARGETLRVLQHKGSTLICKRETLGEMQESIIRVNNLNLSASYSEVNNINPGELTAVLLCVKSKDTIQACQDIQKKLTDNTIVVSIQNGVENEERIASILGAEHTIAALTNIAAEVLEPGIYMQKGNYGFIVSELDGHESDRLKQLTNLLQAADIHVKISKQIYIDLWSKLVWNAAFNPASVLYEMTVGPLLADSQIKNTIMSVMREVKLVAAAQGYKLADDIDTDHMKRTDVPEWYDFRTSMLQDYQRGREIELDDLLGVIVRRGKQFNIPTPYAERLYGDLQSKLSLQR